jgi:hypothetical protein
MKESWNLVLKQCIAKTVIHMLPWFAVASCHETTHDEALKKKVSHATACYGLLTKEATKEVNLRSINADFLKFDSFISVTISLAARTFFAINRCGIII